MFLYPNWGIAFVKKCIYVYNTQIHPPPESRHRFYVSVIITPMLSSPLNCFNANESF